MKLEQEIREALHKESREWNAPKSILHEIKQGIQADSIRDRKGVKRAKGRPNWIRNRIVILTLTIMIILPVGAYAGYQYLADSIYGTSGNGVTFHGERDDYERLEAKLQSARVQLSEAEYAHLEQLLKEGSALLNEFTDGKGDRSIMSAEQLQQLDVLEQKITAASSGLSTIENQESSNVEIPKLWDTMLVEAQSSFNEDDYMEFKHLVTEMLTHRKEKFSDQEFQPLEPYLDRLGYKIEVDLDRLGYTMSKE